jgi:hypothetical protein
VLTAAGINMPGTTVVIVTTTRLPVSAQGVATIVSFGGQINIEWQSAGAGVTTCYLRSLTLVKKMKYFGGVVVFA